MDSVIWIFDNLSAHVPKGQFSNHIVIFLLNTRYINEVDRQDLLGYIEHVAQTFWGAAIQQF